VIKSSQAKLLYNVNIAVTKSCEAVVTVCHRGTVTTHYQTIADNNCSPTQYQTIADNNCSPTQYQTIANNNCSSTQCS